MYTFNSVVVIVRGGLGSQTGCGKNIKVALSPFSFLFLLCELPAPGGPEPSGPYVAIAKTPQQPVRLW